MKTLSKGGQIATPLKIQTKGGIQNIKCVSTKGAFRLIQSIPSKKAEPFKLWLAEVGNDRINEIENPELAQERMKKIYEQKSYDKNWIDKKICHFANHPYLCKGLIKYNNAFLTLFKSTNV